MSCSPVELAQKNQVLILTWQRYRKAPSFENFVEFAVSLNAFTDYLIDKSITGLLHASKELEQIALSLFGDDSQHPVSDMSMQDLHDRVHTLSKLVEGYVHAADRLADRCTDKGKVGSRTTRIVYFVGHSPQRWQDLLGQLSYFGVKVIELGWGDNLPLDASPNPLIIMDTDGVSVEGWAARIKALREYHKLAQIIGLSIPSDFRLLQLALKSGADWCFPLGASLQGVVAQILEMNDPTDQEPFRVLVVEDSLTAARAIQRALEEHQIVTQSIQDPLQVLNALRQFLPDLILMDMYMPNCTGVEAARVIRQHNEFLSIPIVYLSGETDVALQVDALRLGGDHFLTKPFNQVFLNAIVKSKIERYRTLRRSMFHDSLTGLLNHTSTKTSLDAALNQAQRENGRLAVAMLDIDHFKKVNDTYGHPVGDQIIRSLAWLLKQRLRKSDIIGRYGGEEFAIGLVGADAEQARQVLDRIRGDFALIEHPYRDARFNITFSAGIAAFPGGDTVADLINAADEALYTSKRAGRNRITIAAAIQGHA
ncbi:diguanylate cyclase (GGDEF)-like protein [Chitinivorax tropicus]|uniref:diguanylate cyclase n=1 Tax=Chitinivorax tropicus TaxID=714531 RepID=A0A840MPY9_9PROT|nr:diguanylate cyclase [Chitinivorax tropicus]MBB5017311.1 diguanylate cyclase (GGDEF)-like protein [Chitinivorax tropicus]